MRHGPAIATALLGCTIAAAMWQPKARQEQPEAISPAASDLALTSIKTVSYRRPAARAAIWQDNSSKADDERELLATEITAVEKKLKDLWDKLGTVSRESWISQLENIKNQIAAIRRRGGDSVSDKVESLEWSLEMMQKATPPPPPDDTISDWKPPSDSGTISPEPTPYLSSPSIASRPEFETQLRTADQGLQSIPPATSMRATMAPGQVQATPTSPAIQYGLQWNQYAPQQAYRAPTAAIASPSVAIQPTVAYQGPSAAAVTAYRPVTAAASPAASGSLKAQQHLVYEEGRARYRLQRLQTDGFSFFGLGSLYWVKYQEPGQYVMKVSYESL
jgi:hypothetical protein